MLIDARTIQNNTILETDICIIGAGAAGIALAREFTNLPFRVCLLESGGLELDNDTQSLADGENIGLPYYPLRITRLRYFGGTTNHWGGICRPFNDLDFIPRESVPYSGWPFRKSDLQPFYERAQSICQLRSSEWDVHFWEKYNKYASLPLIGDRVITRLAQVVSNPLRQFGKSYRSEIIQAKNITTFLHANVVEIETDETSKTVTRVRVACLPGNTFSVAAKIFVLAAGAIENPRLLLVSDRRQFTGLGNQNDLVGRFFLEHPRFLAGIFRPSNLMIPLRLYKGGEVSNSIIRGYLSLSEDVQRNEQLVDVQVRLDPVYDKSYIKASESKGVSSLNYLLKNLWRGDTPDDFGRHLSDVIADLDDVAASAYWWARFQGEYPINHIELVTRIDPAPNPDSRITLATERDQLGLRRAQLDWRLSPIDKHSARRTLEIIGTELGRAGLGRLKIVMSDDDTTWPSDTSGGFHHMGTTRMNDDAKQGVVDKNCQVHGISNLYIAGSSVFPTGGSGTPTLLLIALALRLADHIKERLR
jgi:choline dehydrogenase-like flavoprotein